jgi:hypothetical protein
MEQPPIEHGDRNVFILRRTLSAIGWLYALLNGLIGYLAWGKTTRGALDAQLLLGHALLLAAAGALLWRPRKGAVVAMLAAAASSIFFVVLDVRRHGMESALLDGLYPALVAVLLIKSRARA